MGASGADFSASCLLLAASIAFLLFSSSRFCIRLIASFSARGKSGAGSPNRVPAFNPPHARSVRNACFAASAISPWPKLLPHLGCRIGQDGIDQRRDYADGFGRGCEHAGLQRRVICLGAVGGLLPWGVGGEVAVGFRDEIPEGFQRIREIQLVESRSELGDCACRIFAQSGFGLGLARPLPAPLHRSICAPC